MRHILIIGPPASGKLSLAKRLAHSHGYFLFDNHRSIDAAAIITAGQSLKPDKLIHNLRKCVFECVVASKISMVFTLVYAHPLDKEEMDVFTAILSRDEPALVVQLHCSMEDSMDRAQSTSRTGTSKLTSPEGIRHLFEQYDMNSNYPAPSEEVLHIDTSITTEEDAYQLVLNKIQQCAADDRRQNPPQSER